MWNPLASLPPSNVGALAPYAPAPQPSPAPVAQPPQPQVEPLHPIFGRHRNRFGQDGSLAGSIADPNAFQMAMQAWRGNMPGLPQGQGADQPFDPRQVMGWREGAFDPRQSMMDWRGARPLRSGF